MQEIWTWGRRITGTRGAPRESGTKPGFFPALCWRSKVKNLHWLLVVAVLLGGAPALAEVKDAIKAAMDGEVRRDADRNRDRNRKPIDTLTFFRIREDMRVLELIPGGGWYTKILAPVLRAEGKLYLWPGTDSLTRGLLAKPGFDKVEILEVDAARNREEGGRRFEMAPFSLPVKRIDLALTFRNLHNFTAVARHNIHAAVFKALKKGGLYGVIDHTRRHMQRDAYENWRRLDPVLVIREIQGAGFEFVDFSDLHYRPDDELFYEVGRKTVTGNTDRFTLLFRKP